MINQTTIRSIWRVITIGMIIGLLVIAPVIAQETTPEAISQTIQAETLLQQAENAQTQVDRAFEQLDGMLNLIQFIITVASIIGVIASFFGLRNLWLQNQALAQVNDKLKILESLENAITSTQKTTAEQLEEIKTLHDEINQQTSALSLVQFAQQQINIDNLIEAENLLSSAYESDKQNRVVNYLLGDVLLRQGQLDESITHLETACEGDDLPAADASYAYALRLKGTRAQEVEQNHDEGERYYAQAIQRFLQVKEKNPRLLDVTGESVFGALAGLYRRQGRIDEAITIYEHAADVTPYNSYPWNNLGILHYQRGDIEKAQGYFQRSYIAAERYAYARPTDYWRLFDMLTALIVLQTVPKHPAEAVDEKITQLMQQIFDLDPGTDPIQKLIHGLESLRNTSLNHPLPHVETTINTLQQHLDE